MTFSLAQLLLFMGGYLSLLFAVGYAAERGLIPASLLEHPAVYVLSLGVFSGVLAIFGASEMAMDFGYSFLLYYLGVVVIFVLSPLLLSPILQLCRHYQLGSIADLLAFRFQSPYVGTVVTAMLLVAMLPLIALQIHAVTDSIHILYEGTNYPRQGGQRHHSLALLFCATIILFTILFGSRSPSGQPRHQGLVATIAFESVIKLLAMLCLGGVAIFQVFGGFGGLHNWLETNPEIMGLLNTPLRQDSARALLLIFFAGAVTMPHIFHMSFAEGPGRGSLRAASWGLPLYLLLLALPVLPITWAALYSETTLPIAYSPLALGAYSPVYSLMGYAAGLSAASAVIIVSTLALANMGLNHIVLPAHLRSSMRATDASNLYEQITWLRRVLAAGIILGGYLFYRVVDERMSLLNFGLVAFVGTLQFLPGLFATLFWPRANRLGLLAGLVAGFLIWTAGSLLPLISEFQPVFIQALFESLLPEPQSSWSATAVLSLALNIFLFITVSLLTPTSSAEERGAAICAVDQFDKPTRQALSLSSAEQYQAALAAELGETIAAQEIHRALRSLDMPYDESRPIAMRRLRERLIANLSGMLGPALASEIVQRRIPFLVEENPGPEDISLIESSIDEAQASFTGLAADLDELRRHHRKTLHELPIGVLSLGTDGEVQLWNRFLEELTGIESEQVVGSQLSSLPSGWASLLKDFSQSELSNEQRLNTPVEGDDQLQGRWISLHKNTLTSTNELGGDQLIVVEDVTDNRLLEQELLHSERLASIGRLAAGVAHEIGNPVTGIACLAQNLEYEEDPAEVHTAAGEILKQTDRVTRIVESLVNFSHTGKHIDGDTRLSATNLADCVDEAIHLLQLDRNAKPVRYNNRCNREHLVLADSQKLLQVFINLLSNARDASSDGQTIDIDSSINGENLDITVTDQGDGIPADIRDQIFEPFFTTKDPGLGTGLGLALVYSILEDMRGRIQLLPQQEQVPGTTFMVNLEIAEYAEEYL